MKLTQKITSLFLVGMMTFSEFTPLVKALEDLNEIKTENNVVKEINKESDSETKKAKGTIEVETNFVLPIKNSKDADVTLTIYDSNNNSIGVRLDEIYQKYQDGYLNKEVASFGEQEIKIIASKRDNKGHLLSGTDIKNNIAYLAVNFNDLDVGTYKLKLTGKNYVTYETEVTLDNVSKRINLTNEKGMFAIGDVTNDGKIDESDVETMLDAIAKNDLDKDLNLDGVTDIADLNYITANINNDAVKEKVEETNPILSSENVTLNVSEGTTVKNGELSDIFTGEGVTLEKTGEDPINLELDLAKNNNEAIEMSEIRINFGEHVPEKAHIVVETVDGEEIDYVIPAVAIESDVHYFTDDTVEGTRVIELEGQIAVKKVTIVIDVIGSDNLADIAKVEFLNNVKVETKEPENFYTPKNVTIDDKKSEQLTVTFNEVPNVTGYEIRINGDKMQNTIFQTTYNNFTIEDLKNYVTYEIAVRAVNGEWYSGWSDVKTATPQATRVPPAVDMVVAEGTFGGIKFSWKKMDDTKSYNIYYRKADASVWEKVDEEITSTSYILRGLEPNTKYEAYLTGNNDLGEGSASQHVYATTLVETATIYPKYKLINDEVVDGKTNHIKDVILKSGTMTDDNKFAMVDDNYHTFWTFNDWAAGSHGNKYNMPTTVLDEAYTMDEFVLTVPDDFKYSYKAGTYDEKSNQYNDTLVYYWNTDGEMTKANATVVPGIFTIKKDENGRQYYVLKLEKPIKANGIQLGITNAANAKLVQIAELKFYEYDSLVDEVADLFVDDLRVELKSDVNKEKIAALRAKADIKDHDEYNPYRDSIIQDLDYAEKILNDEKLNDVITLNPKISNSYDNLGFAMTINDYQPLGVAVRAGETVNIYVGSTGKINIEAVFTQNYAEANTWSAKVALKKGQNIIKVPEIGSATSERGGSLYVRYTSLPDVNNPIKVRVSGGTKIPMLDTTLTEGDEAKTKEAIGNYITELNKYVEKLPSLYTELYKDSEATEKYSYDKTTSALGVTEIVTRHGLWSFSAEAVRDAINSELSSDDAKINRLYESTEAFDEMMELFYRHKGLKNEETDAKKKVPSARINIRMMRMFDGAFMYAGGYHVGIEYGSIAGVIQGKKNTANATGYFGWGISHEVGHQINQGNLVHAEVTNNVYSLLAQTANDSDKSRLEISNIYEKIYDKVTSHTLGKAQNVFVTLGMYWQLHLAYDNNKTFDDTDSIFAKINRESRTYDNSVKKYSKDDLLILLASRAAEKDLTDYFAIWGLKASDAVKNEIKELGYAKETKAIYYLNDAARRYRLNKGTAITNKNILEASVKSQNDADKRVTLTFGVNAEKEKILGYEILRNGESIAFVEQDVNKDTMEFTDNIGSVNNRAFTYEVVAYDYLLNETNKVELAEIKVEHDGKVKKDTFTIESNFKEKNEIVDNENADLDFKTLKVNNLIDDDVKTVFKGTERIKTLVSSNSKVNMTSDNSNAYVIINLNTKMSLCGIEYTGLVEDGGLLDSHTIRKYKVYVSSDKESWTEVASGEFSLTAANNYTEKVYFMKENTDSKDQLWTYDDVSYIKIESVDKKTGLSGAEIGIIAPPGDNVNLDGANIGKLKDDYCYLTAGCDYSKKDENGDVIGIIKSGSVIIQGTYAGSPSFNIVTIADAKNRNKIYGGYQLIFAQVNSDLTVYEVSKGIWLYVMTEEQYNKMITESTSIRANLYRVSDAETMAGQRLTSDSKSVTNLKQYTDLNEITISNKQ